MIFISLTPMHVVCWTEPTLLHYDTHKPDVPHIDSTLNGEVLALSLDLTVSTRNSPRASVAEVNPRGQSAMTISSPPGFRHRARARCNAPPANPSCRCVAVEPRETAYHPDRASTRIIREPQRLIRQQMQAIYVACHFQHAMKDANQPTAFPGSWNPQGQPSFR